MSSEYERIRLRNIEDNKRILAELGIVNPFKPLPRIVKTGVKSFKRKRESASENPPSKRVKASSGILSTPEATDSWKPGTRRRSRRLLGQDAPEVNNLEDIVTAEEAEDDGDDDDEEFRPQVPKDRPHVYGAIPDVEVGTLWLTRMEVNHAGIHRPTVAGIHPGPQGAYSIALSGGYEDDIDLGECFTYTGEGGRDLKGTKANPKNLRTAPQSKDQVLSRGNKALVESVASGIPVRVLRGYKLRSPFAPEEGYRYDGLYKVDKWWFTTGMAGFGVYKFVLSRLRDQPSPPWIMNIETSEEIQSSLKNASLNKPLSSEPKSTVLEKDSISQDAQKISNLKEKDSTSNADTNNNESDGKTLEKNKSQSPDDAEVDPEKAKRGLKENSVQFEKTDLDKEMKVNGKKGIDHLNSTETKITNSLTQSVGTRSDGSVDRTVADNTLRGSHNIENNSVQNQGLSRNVDDESQTAGSSETSVQLN